MLTNSIKHPDRGAASKKPGDTSAVSALEAEFQLITWLEYEKKKDGMCFLLSVPLLLRTIPAAQGKAAGLGRQKRVRANLREILCFYPLDRSALDKATMSPDLTCAFHRLILQYSSDSWDI